MRIITLLSVLAGLALTSVQCRTGSPEPVNPIDLLPPPTQTGENTFGCLVNGEAFVVTNTSQMSAIYQGGGLSISGGKKIDDVFYDIRIFVEEDIKANDIYNLFNDTNHKGVFYKKKPRCFYFTNAKQTGTLKVSYFDNIKFIVSGTFEFNAVSVDCTDTIQITNGRFDMQYIP